MLSDGQNGHGATVALYELASHSTTDVAAYESCCGLANPISSVAVDGGGGATGGGGTVEADADIEQVATQAPGASIVSCEGPNTVSGAFDTWNAIVSADAAQVVSTSWGLCEPLSNSAGYLSSFATLFQKAAAQGQTVLAAAGDFGSEDCDGSNQSTALEVDYPSSDPNVTAVGGTSLFGPGNEVTWNANGGAGGGGISRYFAVPSWQPVDWSWTSTGNPCGLDCRQVPDISANAGVGMVIFTNGAWTAVGGTSLSAPLVAGLVADRNEGCTTLTADLAPTLYGAAAQGLYGSGLTDITSGNNDATGTLSVTSVSGGGVTTWTKGVAFVGSIGAEEEIWFGKVTATGASTVTFTWSASTAGHTMEYGAQEFSAGLGAGTTWALDKSGTLNGASSTSVPFPTLTASRAGELHFGYSTIANNAVATSSGGFTYVPTNEANLAAYDPNVSGAVSPAGTQSPAGTSSAVAGLLVAAP
jgi:subtilase family serine protease